jgi:hypothetical protein
MSTPGPNERISPDGSTLTEADRRAIADRVALEVRLRQEIESPKKHEPKRGVRGWLESSFVLLLLGSALTGLLVPYLQQQQESVKWRRQNQYDNFKYRLTQMRQCLQDFLNLTAYPSDVNEIAKPVVANASVDGKQFDQFSLRFRDLQEKRFHETAKVMSLFIYFPRSEEIEAPYGLYLESVAGLMSRFQSLATETRALADRKGRVEQWAELERRSDAVAGLFPDINQRFDDVVREMRKQIEEVENESEQLK